MSEFDNIKGVLFDLNGIVTDSWRYHSKSWREVAEFLGIAWSAELEEAIKGRDRIDSLNEILKVGGQLDQFLMQKKNGWQIKRTRFIKPCWTK